MNPPTATTLASLVTPICQRWSLIDIALCRTKRAQDLGQFFGSGHDRRFDQHGVEGYFRGQGRSNFPSDPVLGIVQTGRAFASAAFSQFGR